MCREKNARCTGKRMVRLKAPSQEERKEIKGKQRRRLWMWWKNLMWQKKMERKGRDGNRWSHVVTPPPLQEQVYRRRLGHHLTQFNWNIYHQLICKVLLIMGHLTQHTKSLVSAKSYVVNMCSKIVPIHGNVFPGQRTSSQMSRKPKSLTLPSKAGRPNRG